MICSSVYLLFLMSVILQMDGLHCVYAGTTGRGQVRTAAIGKPFHIRDVEDKLRQAIAARRAGRR
jgi:hypothetical protein